MLNSKILSHQLTTLTDPKAALAAVPLEVEPRLGRRVGGVVAELVGVGAVVVRLEVGALWHRRLDALHPLAGVQLKWRRGFPTVIVVGCVTCVNAGWAKDSKILDSICYASGRKC